METYTLNRLSQTCRNWHNIVIPKLYAHLKFTIPDDKLDLKKLEKLLLSRGDGLKYTTGIEVHPYRCSVTDGRPRVARNRFGPDRAPAIPTVCPTMESFNALLRLLLQKIPSDQLVTFM